MHYRNCSIKKMYIFITAFLLTIFIINIFIFKYIGNWLIVNDELKKVDVIIVISGDEGERLQHAVDLFHKKYADYLLVSGCKHPNHPYSYTPAMRDQAVSLGVTRENIIMDLESNSGTGDQAINVIKLMKEKGYKSAILITSNYHTRRSKMLFQRACQKDNIEILVSYPIINSLDLNEWWKSTLGRRMVVYELVKLVWYWFLFSGRNT